MEKYMERPLAQALSACMVPPNALGEQASGSVGHRRRHREKKKTKKIKVELTCHMRII
jgi:hypothetical protein